MKYYDYKKRDYIEVEEDRCLNFLYNNIFGRIILKVLVSSFIAKIVALYMNSSLSKYKIKKFISKNKINMEDYEECNYKSFNDFFIRKIKKGKRMISNRKYSDM